MKAVALLDPQTVPFPAQAREPWGQAVDAIDVYDLPGADLSGYAGLVIEGLVDQEFLHRQRVVIRDFLDDAKDAGVQRPAAPPL
jgi:hypothetical protein